MNFSEAFEAMKAGKKVRRPDMFPDEYLTFQLSLGSGNPMHKEPQRMKNGSDRWTYHRFSVKEMEADNWEIIEDVPEVKLQQSNDTYFICPQCGKYRELQVYSEDISNNNNIHTCYNCGKRVRIVNIGEFYTQSSTDEGPKCNPIIDELIKKLLSAKLTKFNSSEHGIVIFIFNNQGIVLTESGEFVLIQLP